MRGDGRSRSRHRRPSEPASGDPAPVRAAIDRLPQARGRAVPGFNEVRAPWAGAGLHPGFRPRNASHVRAALREFPEGREIGRPRRLARRPCRRRGVSRQGGSRLVRAVRQQARGGVSSAGAASMRRGPVAPNQGDPTSSPRPQRRPRYGRVGGAMSRVRAGNAGPGPAAPQSTTATTRRTPAGPPAAASGNRPAAGTTAPAASAGGRARRATPTSRRRARCAAPRRRPPSTAFAPSCFRK